MNVGCQLSMLRGLAWLRDHPAPTWDIVRLADEAWFFKMLLLRHGTGAISSAVWAEELDVRLDAILALDYASILAAREPLGADLHCQRALAAAMLAHLLHLCRRDWPQTATVINYVRRHVEENALDLFAVSALYNFCFDYNFQQIGLELPGNPRIVPALDELSTIGGLVEAAYYHTHIILFASRTLARELLEPHGLEPSLTFIRRHAGTVIRYGWIDLCAEFALCLSLLRDHGTEFACLVDTLIRLQRDDGRWTHPRCDDRQSRHCTMMAVLAQMEMVGPPAGRGGGL